MSLELLKLTFPEWEAKCNGAEAYSNIAPAMLSAAVLREERLHNRIEALEGALALAERNGGAAGTAARANEKTEAAAGLPQNAAEGAAESGDAVAGGAADGCRMPNCPYCGKLGEAGSLFGDAGVATRHYYAGCGDEDCIGFRNAYDFVSIESAIAAFAQRAGGDAAGVAVATIPPGNLQALKEGCSPVLVYGLDCQRKGDVVLVAADMAAAVDQFRGAMQTQVIPEIVGTLQERADAARSTEHLPLSAAAGQPQAAQAGPSQARSGKEVA